MIVDPKKSGELNADIMGEDGRARGFREDGEKDLSESYIGPGCDLMVAGNRLKPAKTVYPLSHFEQGFAEEANYITRLDLDLDPGPGTYSN